MVHIMPPKYAGDACLLLLRVIVGISFLVAAKNKASNLKKFSKNNGLPVQAAALVMSCEFLAGGALLLGIAPQIAALALMFLMLGTMRMHIFKWHSRYWASSGGWEYDLMLFTMAAVVFVFGPGQFVISK